VSVLRQIKRTVQCFGIQFTEFAEAVTNFLGSDVAFISSQDRSQHFVKRSILSVGITWLLSKRATVDSYLYVIPGKEVFILV